MVDISVGYSWVLLKESDTLTLMNNFQVYVIGVPNRYRGHSLESQFASMKIKFRRINALNAEELKPDYFEKFKESSSSLLALDRMLTVGELCCSLAHLAAYEEIVASDHEWSLILEDDAALAMNLGENIFEFKLQTRHPAIIQLYGKLKYSEQLSYWQLYSKSFNKGNINSKLIKIPRSWQKPEGTYGYLINKEAARVAWHSFQKYPYLVTPADWPIIWRNKVKFYVSIEQYIFERDVNSLLGAERIKFKRNLGNQPSKKSHLLRKIKLISGEVFIANPKKVFVIVLFIALYERCTYFALKIAKFHIILLSKMRKKT